MKNRFTIIVIVLIMLLFFITYIILDTNFINATLNNTTIDMNNSSRIITIDINSSSTPQQFYSDNNSLSIPSNDYVINNINWSSYPNLEVGYIDLAQVMEPNEYVSINLLQLASKLK